MLGVFLLPAFICLGHELQDLLSPCDGVHACTNQTSVYALIRKSLKGGGGGVESEPMLTPRGTALCCLVVDCSMLSEGKIFTKSPRVMLVCRRTQGQKEVLTRELELFGTCLALDTLV